MPEQSASIAALTGFEAWWKERLALRSFPIPEEALPFAKGYAQAAWESARKAGADKLKFADVLAIQTSILIRLIRVGLDVRESNLDDRLLLDRVEDTIAAYREAQP